MDYHPEVFCSDTYGVGRLIAVFGQNSSLGQVPGYGKAASLPCQIEALELVPAGLTLARGATLGTLTLGPMDAPEFDWLVPWWNADCAGSGSLTIFVQVETEKGWSGWIPMEQWGRFSRSFSTPASNSGISVDTDTLLLTKAAKRFSLRFALSALPLEQPFNLEHYKTDALPGDNATVGSVVLSRCGVITRNRCAPRSLTRTLYLRESAIPVPAFSQMDEAPSIRGRICSPTCVTMALASLDRVFPTAFVAADCYDFGQGIFGNWAFNVASLWRLGASARLDFFASMEMASSELFARKILITSIRFQDGSLRGAPIQKTNGHLVLLRGLEKRSDGSWAVLVNDPAAPNAREVPRAYDIADFEKAWSGVAYVVECPR